MGHARRREAGHLVCKGAAEAEYLNDQMVQSAVERCVEIIGEAARNVSEDGRTQVPEVRWTTIVGTRHILAHEYGSIDQSKMWRIATIHVPALVGQLTPILEANPPGPESTKNPAEP